MRIFKKHETVKDPLEERLDIISDLTRDLDRKEFNSLLDAVKAMFEVRQKLNKLDSVSEEKKEDLIEFMEEK
jgi:MoxR-like ATPase